MRILIIEDEINIAKALKKGLTAEGFVVDNVYDGEEGCDLACSESFDLVILDLMLPKMSGEEICTRLRDKNISFPILMLTAKSDLEDKVNGLNMGADDYLTKPFAFEELLARIKALLRRPAEVVPDVLTCGDLSLNKKNFEVKRNGVLIELSKKEFSMLEYLLLNKNKIVSKDNILDHVWEYETDVLPNSVEVYIGYLRNKIDKNHKHPLIKTVRGFGYKISDGEKVK